ncbi:MAG: AAA family ATPase [Candidatus Micrarchaeota archaeon]|nr:AAA family ATPase [Candidatus Micrarchaeota archaeon]
MILCVTGLPGSGKTTVARILKRKGYRLVEMRDGVVDAMAKKHIAITPDSIREYSIKIRRKYGKQIVARYAMRTIRKLPKKSKIAIVGIRSVQEMQYIKKNLHAIRVIGVIAPRMMRYKRLADRGSNRDTRDFKKFEERERQELLGYSGNGKKLEGVGALVDHADFIISNADSYPKLVKDVNWLLAKMAMA